MLTHSEALWLQIITVCGTVLAPIIAVGITIWSQNRESKHQAKIALFMDLVSFRNHIPLPWQFLVALNRIDIVFHTQKDICQLWHEYYDLLCLENSSVILNRRDEKKISLLTAIAHHLGYKQIDQIFLQRYYQSQGSYDEWVSDGQLKTMAVRYFEKGVTVYDWMLQNAQNQGAGDSPSPVDDQ